MKIAVIGGGGVRSMFLAKSIASRAEKMGISRLVFMDTDSEKLFIYGKMAEQVAKIIAPNLDFSLTVDPVEAVTDADYVITTIRVGGDSMRCRDERMALDLGLLGQETTGASGFSFAMRSIPALKKYCELTKKYGKKDAVVFNFTNPAGIVSQALYELGFDFSYGICDAPSGMLHRFEALYGYGENSLKGMCYGLNHLSFFSHIYDGEKDIISTVINDSSAYKKTDLRYFDKAFLSRKGYIPNEYLYYFYYREQAVKNILNAEMTRGEQIEKINREMTKALKNVDVSSDFSKALDIFERYYGERENSYMASETGEKREEKYHFDLYAPDDGGYAGVALNIIDSIKNGAEKPLIACVPNRNRAIDFLSEDDIIESSCEVRGNKLYPFKHTDIPFENAEIIKRVKAYERLAAKAIINCDRETAIDSIYLHPLVASYSLAEKFVDSAIQLNKDYTGEWK